MYYETSSFACLTSTSNVVKLKKDLNDLTLFRFLRGRTFCIRNNNFSSNSLNPRPNSTQPDNPISSMTVQRRAIGQRDIHV